jgi:hypothetical protein
MSTLSATCATSDRMWLETSTGAVLVGHPAQQRAQPAHAFGVEAVGGLVEDEDPRVGQQRQGQAEPLAHAQREPAHAPVSRGPEPTRSSAGAMPAGSMPAASACTRRWARAVRPGWKPEASSTAPTVRSGRSRSRYGRPATRAVPAVGRTSPEEHAQGRRLPRAIGTEEVDDGARRHVEAEIVDGRDVAEALGQAAHTDGRVGGHAVDGCAGRPSCRRLAAWSCGRPRTPRAVGPNGTSG